MCKSMQERHFDYAVLASMIHLLVLIFIFCRCCLLGRKLVDGKKPIHVAGQRPTGGR
jgi:hypothetical protein